MRGKHLEKTKQIVLLLIIYGYYNYFTTTTYSSVSNGNKVKTQNDIEYLQSVTLPPHLRNDELFNLAKPTDSSGKEIFADKKIKALVINGKSANYSALKEYQLSRARACNTKTINPNDKPTCSAAFLREYYEKCDYLLDTGRWKKWKAGYPMSYFLPNVCDMPFPNNTKEYMFETLGKWNARNILVLGDSNAHRFYLTLLKTLTNYTGLDYKCSLLKMEKPGKVADIDYFTNGTKFKADQILIKSRTCSTCNSESHRCILPLSSKYHGKLPDEIELEYLSMTLVTLDGITLKGRGDITQQEFLIKHYLKDRYPDILLIGATFTHDKRKPFDFVQKCLEHFIGLVDDHIPKRTRVMWLNAAAHNNIPYNNCGIGFNLRIFDVEYELKGNEKLEMLNHLLFYVLREKLINKKSNHFAMPDLYALSNKVMKGWALDCVHFKPSWYQTLIAYMFGLLASSD